jgi:hypothetical protein
VHADEQFLKVSLNRLLPLEKVEADFVLLEEMDGLVLDVLDLLAEEGGGGRAVVVLSPAG